MEENLTYKPFAYIDQYVHEEGTLVYYNTEKTLAVKKNDCSYGTSGNLITLTAPANKFVSTISVADADQQAESWLNANAQAYANNIGVCSIRPTAWRGENPSCVLEPATTLLPFDYMIIKYKWALGAGVDLDTFTGFISTGTEWDNKYMGFGHGQGTELPNNSTAIQSYIMFAGDNQKENGVEACLINFKKMLSDYSSLKSIPIRMAGAWFKEIGTGNIDMEITTYSGGTMQKVDAEYDFINIGGSKIQQLTFSKNIPKPPSWVNDIDQVTNIGYITYDKDSSTAKVAITY
ncbi:DUF5977 domain-containing protein [Flavobacterium sp. HBTb2-11-1]|uniref:DUF5977 domain-containing protein n=1 Tax=Flavobacterium sp. HBTb2-11-1 TaxID=2692212 RepID=UPI00136E5661|nr:DUF5977 domain-containing protein [Flavobacterium sp. HBTb2-11-1]MXO07093.1 hypothetical protein [Flavobacterium sp. HBTb2-11-1]